MATRWLNIWRRLERQKSQQTNNRDSQLELLTDAIIAVIVRATIALFIVHQTIGQPARALKRPIPSGQVQPDGMCFGAKEVDNDFAKTNI